MPCSFSPFLQIRIRAPKDHLGLDFRHFGRVGKIKLRFSTCCRRAAFKRDEKAVLASGASMVMEYGEHFHGHRWFGRRMRIRNRNFERSL